MFVIVVRIVKVIESYLKTNKGFLPQSSIMTFPYKTLKKAKQIKKDYTSNRMYASGIFDIFKTSKGYVIANVKKK